MRKRRFGVEIECGYDSPPHECNCDSCGYDTYYDDRDEGVEAAARLLHDNGFRAWTHEIHCDGSGVEIPSPILQGTAGLAELRSVMELLRNNGFWTSTEDGLHVHHEAPEFVNDRDNVRRLIETWANHQELIDEFIAEGRTRNHWACEKTWDADSVKEFDNPPSHMDSYSREYYTEQDRPFIPGGRGALNIHSLWEHGTIEIRQHEGTLDFDQAAAWIRFGQAFIDSVLQHKRIISCGSSAQLLKRIRVSEGAQKVLLAKAAA